MRRSKPELFEKACQLEDLLNERRDELGKDHVYLTRFAKPLREAIPGGWTSCRSSSTRPTGPATPATA
jgi:hypothetical protein